MLLLWFLLWMLKWGLSSPLNPGYMLTSPVHEDRLSLHNRTLHRVTRETTEEDTDIDEFYKHDLTFVRMVDIKNEIYKQFRKRRHSVYMVFNKMELREAVPNPSLLSRAELHLLRRKQHQEQTVGLYEKYRKICWHYLSYRHLTPSNTADWLWFNVTEVVLRWLNQDDEIEVFRLRTQRSANSKNNTLQMDITGITPKSHDDLPDNDSMLRPVLLLLTYPPVKPEKVSSPWYS